MTGLRSGRQPGPWRGSVFWRLAAVLVGALVVTGLAAVGVSAYLWEARSLELVRSSLALRLDTVAEEVEARAEFVPVADGASRVVLPEMLRLDLAARFPDPITLLDADGQTFAYTDADPPAGAAEALASGRVVVRLEDDPAWAVAPIFDPEGVPAGGLLVRPLSASLQRELAGTREATRSAVWIIGILALGLALVLGALLTARLVAPLRRMTDRVEAIGAGDYGARLAADREDEFGRLAAAINAMAARVEVSIDTLRATDRLRRDLVANIGHDLRTPLAGLQGYLEEGERLLTDGRSEEALAALATARRQGQHVERLVRDLFELSVLDAAPGDGRLALQLEIVPVAELLHHAAELHRRRMENAGITFESQIPPDLPTIQGDGARLLRLLDNLLENARRHTPAGGTVRLAAATTPEGIAVRVEDTGEGIPEDAIGTVFDRYFRGTSARTRAHEGSGLGLAIARAIARAHGGELSVASRADEGATFMLTLPLPPQAPLAET
jgi:signal transduction histidine kinase